jgi:hypothetical protein
VKKWVGKHLNQFFHITPLFALVARTIRRNTTRPSFCFLRLHSFSQATACTTLYNVVYPHVDIYFHWYIQPVVTMSRICWCFSWSPKHWRISVFDKQLTRLDPEVYLWLTPTLILLEISMLNKLVHQVRAGVLGGRYFCCFWTSQW